MTLPEPVAAVWAIFAEQVIVSDLAEADYARFTSVALAAHANAVGLDALQDAIIDVASRDGAPEYLAGELTMGLDIALRALSAQSAKLSGNDAEAEAQRTAEEARGAALSKLSAEERTALGLS